MSTANTNKQSLPNSIKPQKTTTSNGIKWLSLCLLLIPAGVIIAFLLQSLLTMM
ncbi:hypothetical protein [Vibrio sp. 99-8-1]|uniref:hypothetical protein n=1 Tax=Vibrio sp. 99-8-1 TaxID=2607602 RepID=UPI001493300D|nr:hypothetical protein [Vibrio sp. 99-8-1]